jgi:nicotinamidase-related amidase
MNLSGNISPGISSIASTAQAGVLPRTLFEMAGAIPQPAELSNAVLIIIDAQHEYVDGALPLAGVDAAITEIMQLLARARNSNTPVIHIMHKGNGVLFNPGGQSFEIVAPLRPLAGETVIEKKRVSAFADTRLEEAIRKTGRKNLIITGFMTHNCVSSTARAASDLGYMPTIVGTATATRDLSDGMGGFVAASALQTASLAELVDRTAWVVRTGRDIQE